MAFEMNSDLKFTYELGQNHTLPFLDILIQAKDSFFVTKVYQKPTGVGRVLNAASKCPDRYKKAQYALLSNELSMSCSSENDLNTELRNCKRILVNNRFANRTIDTEITKLRMYRNNNEPETDANVPTIY
jgi:hypothetical protein